MFPNLNVLANIIPVSTASVEKVFSNENEQA